jgi:hypothetical protein
VTRLAIILCIDLRLTFARQNLTLAIWRVYAERAFCSCEFVSKQLLQIVLDVFVKVVRHDRRRTSMSDQAVEKAPRVIGKSRKSSLAALQEL